MCITTHGSQNVEIRALSVVAVGTIRVAWSVSISTCQCPQLLTGRSSQQIRPLLLRQQRCEPSRGWSLPPAINYASARYETRLESQVLNILTYLLTPWCRVLLEKLTGLQLVKKFAAFYGTQRFITALTSVRHLSLSWASPIQSTYPHSTSWRSILISSTHLRLGLPSGLFPSGFPTKTLYAPLSSPIRATGPAHLILLDFITRTILGEEYRSFSSSLCSLLHSPVTSSLLGPNILLNTIFSNTLSFLSSLNVSAQVSHPFKTTGKIKVLSTLKRIFSKQSALSREQTSYSDNDTP